MISGMDQYNPAGTISNQPKSTWSVAAKIITMTNKVVIRGSMNSHRPVIVDLNYTTSQIRTAILTTKSPYAKSN